MSATYRPDVLVELSHKALAESKDLAVGFPFWIKVGATPASTQGEGDESVFENLLEAQKLDDGQIDGRMKSLSII